MTDKKKSAFPLSFLFVFVKIHKISKNQSFSPFLTKPAQLLTSLRFFGLQKVFEKGSSAATNNRLSLVCLNMFMFGWGVDQNAAKGGGWRKNRLS